MFPPPYLVSVRRVVRSPLSDFAVCCRLHRIEITQILVILVYVIFLSLVHRLFFIARCSVNSIMGDDVQIVTPRLGSILACATEMEHLHRCLLIRVD